MSEISKFVHLHNHTEYSFLDGAIKIKNLVKRAVEFNMPALAITDHGGMFGAIEFYNACMGAGIKPIIGFEVKIVDSMGNELPPGPDNIGEIIARNRVPLNLEYQNASEYIDTAQWFRTNDIGYMDSEGYIFFRGRLNDIVKKGTRLVPTQDIENFANAHPFILESSAFGVPNGKGEEEIKICVVLKNELSYEELADYLNRNLAYYMVPRYIEFKETLERTPTEQIKKFILKKEWDDIEIKKITWDQKLERFCA